MEGFTPKSIPRRHHKIEGVWAEAAQMALKICAAAACDPQIVAQFHRRLRLSGGCAAVASRRNRRVYETGEESCDGYRRRNTACWKRSLSTSASVSWRRSAMRVRRPRDRRTAHPGAAGDDEVAARGRLGVRRRLAHRILGRYGDAAPSMAPRRSCGAIPPISAVGDPVRAVQQPGGRYRLPEQARHTAAYEHPSVARGSPRSSANPRKQTTSAEDRSTARLSAEGSRATAMVPRRCSRRTLALLAA